MGVGVGSSLELDVAFGHLGDEALVCCSPLLGAHRLPCGGVCTCKGRGRDEEGPKGGGDDSGIGGHGVKTEKPPCVGICHYNRIFGIVTPEPKPREVCVGLCYLNKLNLSQGLPGVLWKRGPG